MNEPSPADAIIAEYMGALRDLMDYYGALHYAGLSPLDPDAYFDSLLDRSAFREPKDKSRKLAEKDAGVSLLLKARASFSKSAKADLEGRQEVAKAKQVEYATNLAKAVEEQRIFFEHRQQMHNQHVDEQWHSYIKGEPSEVLAYNADVLCRDDFTLDFLDNRRRYDSCAEPVSYDPDKKSLTVSFRIPDAKEICTIGSFVDNKKEQIVEPKDLPTQQAYKLRMQVLHAILVRTAAEVFYSDRYRLIDALTITGHLEYYDSAYGHERRVDVIRSTVLEAEFLEVILKWANLDDLFARLFKTKVVGGLYKKQPYELPALT